MSEKKVFRLKHPQRKGPKPKNKELTWAQDWVFWKDFEYKKGAAFQTAEAREETWHLHKDDYMEQFRDTGVRPGAWWQYSSGIDPLPKFAYRGNSGYGGPEEYVDELEFLVKKGFASEAEIEDFESGRGALNYRE